MTWMLPLALLLGAAQEAGPADVFHGAWGNASRWVVADPARYDRCTYPTTMRPVGPDLVEVDDPWSRRIVYRVRRENDHYLWTPVDPAAAEPVRIRPSAEGGYDELDPDTGQWRNRRGPPDCAVPSSGEPPRHGR